MKKIIFLGLIAICNLLNSQSIDNGIMHISFDDGLYIFKDLTDSAQAYTSAFKNPFLAELKTLHDSTGAKFSIYCFTKSTGWELANTTTAFANEFSANSDWLKFGIHQGLTTDNYSTGDSATVVADFEYFLEAMDSIAGNDSASIDFMPRLHNFAGNEVSCQTFKQFGFKGFLGADDTRDSYYLTGSATSSLTKGDCYFECNNSLYIFKSETRLEKVSNINTFLSDFLKAGMAKQAKNLIIFTHEYECYNYDTKAITSSMIAKLEACCKFSVENNYRFDFPQNIVSDSFCYKGYEDVTDSLINNAYFNDTAYTNGNDYLVPIGWILDGNLVNGDIKLICQDSLKDDYAYAIKADTGSSFDFYQDIDLAKGDYMIKIRLEAVNPDSLFLYVSFGDTIIKSNSASNTWDSWITIPISFTLAADSTVRIGISSSLPVTLDDFQLFKVPVVVSVQDSKSDDTGFNIFPNPTSSSLNLRLPADFKNGIAEIYDISGKQVLVTTINKDSHLLDVSLLKKGMYFLTVTSERYSWNAKFLKGKD